MTPREAQCLRFIGDYTAANGYPPCYQEIADGIGLASKSNLCRLADQLVRAGKLRRVGGARSLEVVSGSGPSGATPIHNPDRIALALIAKRLLPLDQRATAAAVIADALAAGGR